MVSGTLHRGDFPGERWLLRQDGTDSEQDLPDATEAIVRHVLSLGINFFDTANGYSADTLRSKTDRIEMRDMEIVRRVQELAEGHGSKMQQIALVCTGPRGWRPPSWAVPRHPTTPPPQALWT